MREHPERPDHDGPLEQNPLRPARGGLRIGIYVVAALIVLAVVAFALVRLATAGQNTPGPASLGALTDALAAARMLF